MKNNKACGVIQATFASDIFPGKSIVKIAGKTVLNHIVERFKKMENVSNIVLATSDLPEDNTLAAEAARLNIKVFRGSEFDVVLRLCKAVEICSEEIIIKVNGNYPLFDPFLANDLFRNHIVEKADFSYNEHLNGTLYGTGCEIFNKKALFDLNTQKLTQEQREAGTLYFHQNESKFKIIKLIYPNPRPHYKVCFDTEKDFELINFLIKNLEKPYTEEIITFLDNNPILAESNKHESIQEVGLEKLYLFPEKITALKRKEFYEPDYTYPISVEVSLTNRCNFNCQWCSDKDLRARISDDIDIEVLRQLFIDLKQGGTRGIVIEGGGEPTIHKNFPEVVNYAHDLGFGIGLITNGNVSIPRGTADKLDWIRVSLDSSNAEEAKRLKNNDSFERVMSNIKKLCSLKAAVGIGYVVTAQNIGSLESVIIRLLNFGVRYIQFRPVIDHPELETNIDLSYLKRYENQHFSIIIDGMRQNIVEGNSGLPCTVHSLTTVITSDGGVYLCGRLNIHSWFEPMGNIYKESFKDIWFGEKRKKQAEIVSDPEFCKKYCPRCRLTKFNQLFNRLDKIKTRNFI